MIGATAYEFQFGRVLIRILRPHFINRRSLARLIRITWVHKCPVSGEDCMDYKDCKNKNYCWLK